MIKENDQKKFRDPRGTVTHDGQPRGNKQIDSFCSNLLDDLVKVQVLYKSTCQDGNR